MPCNSDYLDATEVEKARRKTAKLFVYVWGKLGTKVPAHILKASKDYYGEGVDLDGMTESLCSTLRAMPGAKRDAIVYNAKDPMSRKLADWWERHQAADAARQAKVKKVAALRETRKAALAKLTPAERRALGV